MALTARDPCNVPMMPSGVTFVCNDYDGPDQMPQTKSCNEACEYRRNSTFKDHSENGGENGGIRDPQAEKEKETASTLALQQLIARVLVDPATSIPLDSNSLHKKARPCSFVHTEMLAIPRVMMMP